MLSPESPRKNKLLQLSTFCSLKSISLQKSETQKERKANTYRRSCWRQWDNRKSCGKTDFVHIFIPSVHFKQKSEVSAAKNFLSQRLLSAIISDFTRKGELHYELKTHENLVIFFTGYWWHFQDFFYRIFEVKLKAFSWDNHEKSMKVMKSHENLVKIFMTHEMSQIIFKAMKYSWKSH